MKDASPEMQAYFDDLTKKTKKAFDIGQQARSKGYDPEEFVEIKIAANLAERVVGLISSIAPQIEDSGVVQRIQELEDEYGALDWRVCLVIAHEIAEQKFCDFETELEAMEVGIRTGFAYITVGVVSAPLEGFTSLELKERNDGQGKYFCLNYSGPVRAAGGTAASVSVLISDYVRKQMGYQAYDPTKKEIRRCQAELQDYHQYVANLQYYPSKEESEFLMKNLPVEIGGDASEKYEISNAMLKDLPRVPTNRLRSGYCLIHSSCVPLKAPKMWKRLEKWGHEFDMEHWDFLEEFLQIQTDMKSKGGSSSEDDQESKLKPNYTYIKDLVGGRPIMGHPMKQGGLRIRYGRSRGSGFSGQSIHPATMVVSNEFVAIGTQLKTERPGKAAAYTSCDTIDGPIVKLHSGEVKQLHSEKEARDVVHKIKKILYLGDVLINYGDFLDRAKKLVPVGYTPERWSLEVKKYREKHTLQLSEEHKDDLEKALQQPLKHTPSWETAQRLAQQNNVSLHPAYTYYYNILTVKDIKKIQHTLKNAKTVKGRIVFKNDKAKKILEDIGTPHLQPKENITVIEKPHCQALQHTFKEGNTDKDKTVFQNLTNLSGTKIRDKAGTFIGTRMGRPEKAKMRTLTGSPHVLFPVGEEGGRLRSFNAALKEGKVTSNFQLFDHGTHKSPLPRSERTGEKGKLIKHEKDIRGELKETTYTWTSVDIQQLFDDLTHRFNINVLPDLIKGVRGTTNQEHVAEHLLKGILRAKHGISVNKDGTIRYDCSELPITHFKPLEIGVSIEKLKEYGYTEDIHGEPLQRKDQICEMKVQDIIIPCCDEAIEDPADDVLLKTCNFIDDLLQRMYGLEPYYNAKTREDLVGKLVIGLAPHTSAGIVCRIIGFHEGQTFNAHPYVHAAMRRDCDGDETGFILLLDGFLNFSNKYLPNSRGSTMDAPLVLTSRIISTEVDDMIFNMDVVSEYPLELYEASDKMKMPWDVDIEVIEDRIGKPSQYENIGFTHDTTNINEGVKVSAYKTLPSMDEKVEAQMDLAVKIRAVDQSDVAKIMINKHFIRDTKGNLKKFSLQQFRCVHCNEKYRRPPLQGSCEECGGKVIFTISEGSITKYMDLSLSLAKKYKIEPYTKQVLDLTQQRIEGVFGREKEVQSGLDDFF